MSPFLIRPASRLFISVGWVSFVTVWRCWDGSWAPAVFGKELLCGERCRGSWNSSTSFTLSLGWSWYRCSVTVTKLIAFDGRKSHGLWTFICSTLALECISGYGLHNGWCLRICSSDRERSCTGRRFRSRWAIDPTSAWNIPTAPWMKSPKRLFSELASRK